MTGLKNKFTIALILNILFFVIFFMTGNYINASNFFELILRVAMKLFLANGVFVVIYDKYDEYDGLRASVLLIVLSSIFFPILLFIGFRGPVEAQRLLLGSLIISSVIPLGAIVVTVKNTITNVLPEEIGKPLILVAVLTLFVDSTFLLVFFSSIVQVFLTSFGLLFIVGPLPLMASKLYFLYKLYKFERKPKRATINYS